MRCTERGERAAVAVSPKAGNLKLAAVINPHCARVFLRAACLCSPQQRRAGQMSEPTGESSGPSSRNNDGKPGAAVDDRCNTCFIFLGFWGSRAAPLPCRQFPIQISTPARVLTIPGNVTCPILPPVSYIAYRECTFVLMLMQREQQQRDRTCVNYAA